MSLVPRALERARELTARPWTGPRVAGSLRSAGTASGGTSAVRTVAVGDPQAPLETFLGILDVHGLLGDDGALLPSVHLISMGDHFDWGKPAERSKATDDATALLLWLASHPAEQVTLLAGNHDLARVGELHGVDDETFGRAQALADASYIGKDAAALARFRAEHPGFATDEIVSRDFSCFRAAQRDLVEWLLEDKRLRLAHAAAGMLFVHAGITTAELAVVGAADSRDPGLIAARLNAALDEAVARRKASGEPLVIDGLHAPGTGSREGGGALFHRPSLGLDDEERHELAQPAPRRRFHPDALPRGLIQVVGHIRDSKCRRLLASIADHAPAQDGVLRTLVISDEERRYTHGVRPGGPSSATMIFTDAGMQHLPPQAYPLLDVQRRDVAGRG